MNNNTTMQVQQLWDMLDEMSRENPAAYSKFIQKHLKEGKEMFEPPKAHMSVQTINYNDRNATLFVNFFQWTKVPEPKSDEEPIPICDGVIIDNKSEGNSFKSVSVAFHPNILQKYGREAAEDYRSMLINLAFDSLENLYNLKLSRKFTILKDRCTGEEKLANSSLMKSFYKEETGKVQQVTPKDFDISDIFKLTKHSEEPEEANADKKLVLQKSESSKTSQLKPLVEEISSETTTIKKPQYEINTFKEENEEIIACKISLPGIRCADDCVLEVSEDDLVLSAGDKYYLQLDLDNLIDPNKTEAKFVKESSCMELKFTCVK